QEPTQVVAYAQGTGGNSAAPQDLDARLWYRGHVRTKPCEIEPPPTAFVEYDFAPPKYGPPTVEIQGSDSVRGSVMVVFDCSDSRKSADRFPPAQREVIDLLNLLGKENGGSLRVGLMAYGRQTPADGAASRNNEIIYDVTMRHDQRNNLTPFGNA